MIECLINNNCYNCWRVNFGCIIIPRKKPEKNILKENKKKNNSEGNNCINQTIIKLTEPCQLLLLTIKHFKRHVNEVNVFFFFSWLQIQVLLRRWPFHCTAIASFLCMLNVWCVLAASEYLMKPWQVLHRCSFGH